nr:MAG TPA: hypothetical protein [Caudoviricetes sp.]
MHQSLFPFPPISSQIPTLYITSFPTHFRSDTSSAKYSTGTPKYFAKISNLSNFGLLLPRFQSERTDCGIFVSFDT